MKANENAHDRLEFIRQIESETDRQLLERQTYYLASVEKSNQSIKKNVQFFYWLFAVGIILTLIIMGANG